MIHQQSDFGYEVGGLEPRTPAYCLYKAALCARQADRDDQDEAYRQSMTRFSLEWTQAAGKVTDQDEIDSSVLFDGDDLLRLLCDPGIRDRLRTALTQAHVEGVLEVVRTLVDVLSVDTRDRVL